MLLSTFFDLTNKSAYFMATGLNQASIVLVRMFIFFIMPRGQLLLKG